MTIAALVAGFLSLRVAGRVALSARRRQTTAPIVGGDGTPYRRPNSAHGPLLHSAHLDAGHHGYRTSMHESRRPAMPSERLRSE